MKEKVLTIIVSSALAIVILLASITTLALQPSMINTSYNEYLSVERPISRFFTIDLGFVFYIDEVSGYLYKLDLETDESTLLLEASVKENIEYGDRVYCILQNNKIVSLKYDGSDLQNLYQGNAEIKNLWTDGEALFFQHGNSICRYHIPSKILDTLVTSYFIKYFRPVSNLKIEWTEYTLEWIKYMNSDEYEEDAFALYGMYPGFDGKKTISKVYNDSTKYSTVLDFDIDYGDYALAESLAVSTPNPVIINGKSVPLANWGTDKYFSTYGEPDGNLPCNSCHKDTSPCSINGCDCKVGLNRSNGYAIQCVGFAYFAYRTIWNQPSAKFTTFVNETPQYNVSTNSNGLSELLNFFKSLDPGTMMIGRKRGGDTDDEHAFVVTYVDGGRVAVYEANVGDNCEISYRFVSVAYLQGAYEFFYYIYQEPFA